MWNPGLWGLSSNVVCVFVCAVPDEEPTGPVFTTWPQSQNVDEGSPVTFSCTLDSPAALTGLCVCVCLCSYVSVRMRVCVSVCVCMGVSVCMCVCEYICMCAWMSIHPEPQITPTLTIQPQPQITPTLTIHPQCQLYTPNSNYTPTTPMSMMHPRPPMLTTHPQPQH